MYLSQKIFAFESSQSLVLQECINFEINIGGKIYNFISLYTSPSQTQDEFEKFIENLELNLESLCQNNPFLILLTAQSKNCYCHDKCNRKCNSTIWFAADN